MSDYIKSWQTLPGINNVASYQVSGRPFASGGIDATNAYKVEFPYVTRWVKIFNYNISDRCKVGFSEAGVRTDFDWVTTQGRTAGTNYFEVINMGGAPGLNSEAGPLELKVSELWLSGSDNMSIVAGLTTIPTDKTNMDPISQTNVKPNWSGSSGVG